MDELKISSGIMRGVVSKLISMMIKKKFGYKASIQLNDLHVTINNEKAHIHIDADAEMDSKEFTKIQRIIDAESQK